jgi:hypothetical protein
MRAWLTGAVVWCAAWQVAAVRDSVVEAFHYAEEHKACYMPYRDMVLFHDTLDIPGLAPLFKAKDQVGSEALAAVGGAHGGT